MTSDTRPEALLRLPPLDGATAARLLDLCALLQQAIWHSYGDEVETHWTTTEPSQPIYGHLQPKPCRRKR